MTDANFTLAQDIIRKAYQALRANDRAQARQYAVQASQLDPSLEDPWLILAGLAGPQAAIQYLKRALQINPNSERAHKGMLWAVQRLEAATPPAAVDSIPVPVAAPVSSLQQIPAVEPALPPIAAVSSPQLTSVEKPSVSQAPKVSSIARPARRAWVGWMIGLLVVLLLACVAWLAWPMISAVFAQSPSQSRPVGVLQKPSLTPTATETPTFTPTFTATATFTFSPTSTATPQPTSTFTAEPTDTRIPPTKTKPASTQARPSGNLPSNIQADQRWVDVDISDQRAYAYQGSQVLRSFLVSTGISSYPTVTGQYRIYVKYRYADMSGIGWYLPKVPYVMYFYKGYGLHGTYWHNNFGHPMSHGCINFRIEDAAWLFDFASVGTLVNIHN